MSTTRTNGRGASHPGRRLVRRVGVGGLAAVLATGAALPLVATSASATLTGPGVEAGRNVTVFHNIDMVAVFGYGPVGTTVTVDVYRGTARIGTASGPAVASDDGPGLEVNHGPEGAAQPGDCWIGAAPDIKPGDRIEVRHSGDEDEVTVDDIHFEGTPFLSGTDVLVHGVALRANGTTAIPASALDSAEFRDESGKYRTAPRVEARSGVNGGFTLRYSRPYLDPEGRNRDGLTEEQRRTALLEQDGHAIGFGHTEPLPRESMLVDGLIDDPGHAPGCGGTPDEPTEPEPFEPEPEPADTVAPPAPSVNPATGTYTSAQSVTMSDAEAGAIIRYTTDGTDPTVTSTRYTGPISVTSSRVIKVAAFDAANNRSTITRRDYTISTATATTRTLTVYAKADTTARQSSPGTKFGSEHTLKSDTQAIDGRSSRETAYVKFDIPALQAGESITGARLGLNVTNGTANGPTVYRTATGWSESTLTWYARPSRSNNGNPVGNIGSLATGKRSTGVSLSGLGGLRTVSYELHADTSDGLGFSSRESGNRAQLILTVKKS